MFVTKLYCPKCGKTYSNDSPVQVCTCGSPLLVEYDLDVVKNVFEKEDLSSRNPDLWRYRELLPVKDEKNIISLGEGMTPMLPAGKAGKKIGIPNLFIKDDGIIPTGSFKARGASVGVSMALELGVKKLAMPTNGNAGGAWSTYCAPAGIDAIIVMPKDAPNITRKECAVSGAYLYLVNGLISDAGKIVAKAVKDYGIYDASTLKEPYRIEGKKTMGLEIAEQFGWEVPDVIIYPTGGGVGLIGIYKGLKELQKMGWIGSKMPRLVSVQSSGCAPIVKAWEEKREDSVFWENSETVAFGINVPKALGDFLVLDAIYKTDGCAVAVDDKEILKYHKIAASSEGLFMCPEGAAAIAAAAVLRERGWIEEDERVVLLNTGSGLKYPDTVNIDPPLLEPGDSIALV